MTKAREKAIKMYWEMAKEKCPFQTEEIVNGYLEGFIDCAELFEEEDKLTLTKYARIIIDKKDECIEDLEKENALLKGRNEDFEQQIMGLLIKYEEVYKRFPDLKSAMDKAQTVLKENAELKEEIETKDILIKELQEQKIYWKDSSFDWRHKFFKLDKVKRLIKKDKQLTKAKELLAKWVELYKPKLEGFPKPPIQVDTEQFLKESE